MKRRYFFIMIITVIFSCNTKKPGKVDSHIDTPIISHIDTAKITTDNNANITTDTHYFWSSEWGTKKGW